MAFTLVAMVSNVLDLHVLSFQDVLLVVAGLQLQIEIVSMEGVRARVDDLSSTRIKKGKLLAPFVAMSFATSSGPCS